MAGTSKCEHQHKKAAADAKRGKIFTRLIKEITARPAWAAPNIGANPGCGSPPTRRASRTCRRTRSTTRSSAARASWKQ